MHDELNNPNINNNNNLNNIPEELRLILFSNFIILFRENYYSKNN